MSSPREQCLNVARVLKKTDRYKMMISSMREAIKFDPKLNAEERNLIARPYKALINERRESLRVISAAIEKENSDTSPKVLKFRAFKGKVATELSNICNEFIILIESKLIPNVVDQFSKIFFLQLKADVYRYLCEFADITEIDDFIEKATDSYNQAINLCLENFPKNHPTSLRVHLNYSVFLFEIMKKKQEALSLLEAIFSDCSKEIQELQKLTEAQQSESRMLLQLICDNLALWQKGNTE